MIGSARVERRLHEAGLEVTREGTPPPGFTALRIDSRLVTPGDLFCAIRGTRVDGHSFLDRVAAAGAAGAVVELAGGASGLPRFVVSDSRIAASHLAELFQGDPARRLTIAGITGTNGKTTTALLLRHLTSHRMASAAVGTLGTLHPDGRLEEGRLTTPDALGLSATLRALLDEGARFVAMEVSSHALEQHRADAIPLAVAVFTNLTRDHLDYHVDMGAYREAKLRLIELLGQDGGCAVNADEPAWNSEAFGSAQVLRYGFDATADVRAEDPRFSAGGSEWDLVTPSGRSEVRLPLLGSFNISNALAAAAAAHLLGLDATEIALGLSAAPQVPGRMEVLVRRPALVVRDYAHTPDALERALEALRPSIRGRLIVVFGCGGDRDAGKRPAMGRIGVEGSDYAVITSDNPRTEDPAAIIHDTIAGLQSGAWEAIVDRREAIRTALEMAEANDGILLAGKGHETYQEVGEERLPFDEAVVVADLLAQRERKR
ncbi:MAG: UDP-N-acetylmuramoyl-L-alanyl-D-glutamate--2,6-diaminopimelate ligase [marine benthic group bacterium]|nr:UDP-N-acetylmuramoyl-L-alanyl-D-glutamate--2,6-diaminopimelate ligase [Gemmatimonadota bacterium]